MARTSRVIGRTRYTTTETIIGPLTVQKQWNWVGLSIDRTGWTDSASLTVIAEYSTDNGVTWIHLLGFTCTGGTGLGSVSSVEVDNPPPAGSLIRGRITATGGAVKQDLSLIEDDVTPKGH